jgi:hypothetical protein
VAEGEFRQQTDFPDREAPDGGAQAASVSADNASSAAFTKAQQAAQQARIDAGRHDTIGAKP